MNQKQAVYTTTMNVLADAGKSFDDGQTPTAAESVTKEQRASIIGIIVEGFKSGEIDMTPEGKKVYDTDQKMRKYVSGLVTNWFKKDTRLNGGTKHIAKNPGSRVGAGDDQLKALKALRGTTNDAEALQAIDAAIEQRKSEISTVKQVSLTDAQLALIPEALRAKLGLSNVDDDSDDEDSDDEV